MTIFQNPTIISRKSDFKSYLCYIVITATLKRLYNLFIYYDILTCIIRLHTFMFVGNGENIQCNTISFSGSGVAGITVYICVTCKTYLTFLKVFYFDFN